MGAACVGSIRLGGMHAILEQLLHSITVEP